MSKNRLVRVSGMIPADLKRRIAAATAGLRDEAVYGRAAITEAAIVRAGVEAEVVRLEKEHNGGQPWRGLRGRSRVGRPRRIEE
ncbi:MAG: hypothetical protein KC591_14130 [Gemmatimonadetes bacterium]|nr:hypothetical protein [Gemmatimonadota bacterium]